MRALFFLLLHRLTSGLAFNRFVRDSHRKSGVLSYLCASKPGGFMQPSGAPGAHGFLVRPRVARRKRKENKNAAEGIPPILSALTCGFPRPR
jgi:hypothetical protein